MSKKRAFGKAFARRAVLFSTALMAVLFAVFLILYTNRASMLQKCAGSAAERGDYEQAVSLLEASDGEDNGDLIEYRYRLAVSYLEQGRLSDAETLFSQLAGYRDSREMISECRYRAADLLYENGEYETAKDAFYALAGYSDALDRYDACRYEIASRTEATDANEAFRLFRALGSYGDAKARAEAIAIRLTGETDPEFAVNAMLGISNEKLEQIRALDSVRDALPKGRLAVGFYHTVGLRSDGTAVAVGRNDEGQCNVSAWTNVKAIDCGAYHTAALLDNGTVVAVGRNDEGQCETGGWTNIVELVCTDYNTVGLTADGTIVSTGFQAFSELSGWQHIKALGGGSYAVCGVSESGQVLSSHASMRSEELSDAIAVDVSTGYCVALRADGTLQCTARPLPWTDVVAVSAGSTGILALDREGKVHGYWFRSRDAIECEDLSSVAAIAAGGTHCAFLLFDGTVVTRGENPYGECDTAAWNLGATSIE